MRKFITLLFVILTGIRLLGATYTVATVPNVHLQDPTRYVSNPDGVLSAETVARADSLLRDITAKSSAEVAVVAINDFDVDDINDFATDLFEKWGIGKRDKDNGCLILIARGRRKAVIRTGYGLEGVLPDITCGRLLREVMFPEFKKGDFNAGTLNTIEAIHSTLTSDENLDEILSKYANNKAPPMTTTSTSTSTSSQSTSR